MRAHGQHDHHVGADPDRRTRALDQTHGRRGPSRPALLAAALGRVRSALLRRVRRAGAKGQKGAEGVNTFVIFIVVYSRGLRRTWPLLLGGQGSFSYFVFWVAKFQGFYLTVIYYFSGKNLTF